MIKCSRPYASCTLRDLTQGFSQEHQANDFASKYGTWLLAPFDAKVNVVTGAEDISVYENNPSFELKRGNGIRLVSIENPDISIMYWHCLPIFPVKVGDTVVQGQPVAQMGNTGYVVSNGVVVPYELRDKPPYLGTHVHLSFGTKVQNWDFSKFIDWTIPVRPDYDTAIKMIIKRILGFFKINV